MLVPISKSDCTATRTDLEIAGRKCAINLHKEVVAVVNKQLQ
jgi:hypothetical protein